jgi:phosphonate ABC transporter permease subunit PhnE
LGAGALIGNLFSKLGQMVTEHLSKNTVRIFNLFIAGVSGAVIFAILGAMINWLYQINDPFKTLWIPAAVGAVLGALLSLRYGPKDLVPIGSVVYMVLRTILNAARSIEPLIYVIVFVVWVGIGPFAGALALALHTIAALAKLYSEQVESILPGPLEAVTATGANRLQTIVYAVVPQIIPPYISFTMYRWDINVRMSTIIGFAGGGGIGFLLQQNIRLLDYRAAAVQMLAIALVVATMDYTSALIREKFV